MSGAARSTAWGVAGIVLCVAGLAVAQDSAVPVGSAAAPPSEALRQRFGLEAARQLIASDEPERRLRGVERLGTLGTPAARAVLVEYVSEGGLPTAGRLVAARALAPQAEHEEARQALVQLMTGGSGGDAADALAPLVRSTAALALAASGSPEAHRALAHAIRTEGPAGVAAADALLAHPPRELDALVGRRGAVTTGWVELLAELGDQRAFLRVREAVTSGPVEVRAAAAVALTRLGALETVELARHWDAQETSPVLRRAAAEILVLTRAPEAPSAVAKLLADDDLRDAGLELALAAGDPELVPPLVELARTASEPRLSRIVAAIGRAGSDAAARALEQWLADPARSSAAAYALAQAEGKPARHALERALERPATRRLAARAAVVRAVTLADLPTGTQAVLEELRAASTPADRFVGAWGLVSLEPHRAADLLAGDDPLIAQAVAVATRDPAAAAVLAARLAAAPTARERAACAAVLALPEGVERIPTPTLLTLLADGGAAAPAAAQALAARDAPGERARIERLLASDDVAIRAHSALGLGASRHPSAVGLLERAYRLEPEARVRRGIVLALGARSEPTRRRTLELAAQLDGDPAVRAAARTALRGQTVERAPRGAGAVWMRVDYAEPAAGTAYAVALELPTGQSLPVVADPEGFVVVVGVPLGTVGVRLSAIPLDGAPPQVVDGAKP